MKRDKGWERRSKEHGKIERAANISVGEEKNVLFVSITIYDWF